MTYVIFSLLRSRFHSFEADWASLKIIVKLARLVPLPLVLRCQSRIIEKVDSIGLVIRKCPQCSAQPFTARYQPSGGERSVCRRNWQQRWGGMMIEFRMHRCDQIFVSIELLKAAGFFPKPSGGVPKSGSPWRSACQNSACGRSPPVAAFVQPRCWSAQSLRLPETSTGVSCGAGSHRSN